MTARCTPLMPTTGAIKMANAKTGGVVFSSPAISQCEEVFFGSWDDHVYAVDADTGREIWRCRTGDWVVSSPLRRRRNRVRRLSGRTPLRPGRSEDGQVRLATSQTGDRVESSPTVDDGVVYFGSFDNHLYAADAATGDLLWRYATGGSVSSSPRVADGVVYVGSADGQVYALRASV